MATNNTTIVAKVYRTTDYSMFKRLTGNRDVSDRAKKIIDSIESVGYVMSPLLVNENREIIDGQGRLEALKTLELPVDFIVQSGIGYDECVAMNIGQTNWKLEDYIHSYAEKGNTSYLYVSQLLRGYKKYFQVRPVCSIAAGNYGQVDTKMIREGRLKCDQKLYDEAVRFFEKTKEVMAVLKGFGKQESWISALFFCEQHPKMDVSLLVEKIFTMRAELYPVIQVKQALEIIEKIWNYRNRSKVYLVTDYRKAMDTITRHTKTHFSVV